MAQTVLVHSAAGGVGLMCLHLLRKTQSTGGIVATVGTQHKVDFLLRNTQLKREQIVVRTSGLPCFLPLVSNYKNSHGIVFARERIC